MNEWKLTFKITKLILYDAIFFCLAGFVLFLFIAIWLSPDSTIWVGELNIAIRTIETLLCATFVVWSTIKIVKAIKEIIRREHEKY